MKFFSCLLKCTNRKTFLRAKLLLCIRIFDCWAAVCADDLFIVSSERQELLGTSNVYVHYSYCWASAGSVPVPNSCRTVWWLVQFLLVLVNRCQLMFGLLAWFVSRQQLLMRPSSDILPVVIDRVPTPPGKSWIFFLKIPGPGKSWKITLVLESPGN